MAVEHLGRLIGTGELPPAAQINTDEMCEQLNISRGVLREALRVLQDKGMVEARTKLGTWVLPDERWNLLDRDVILWRVQGPQEQANRQIRELLELRSIVEPVAAAGCARQADDEHVARLLQLSRSLGEAIAERRRADFMAADIEFHTLLLVASGNGVFRQFSGAIEAVLRARENLLMLPDQVGEEASHSHDVLARAIAAGDAARAEELSRAIVDAAEREMLQNIGPAPARVH